MAVPSTRALDERPASPHPPLAACAASANVAIQDVVRQSPGSFEGQMNAPRACGGWGRSKASPGTMQAPTTPAFGLRHPPKASQAASLRARSLSMCRPTGARGAKWLAEPRSSRARPPLAIPRVRKWGGGGRSARRGFMQLPMTSERVLDCLLASANGARNGHPRIYRANWRCSPKSPPKSLGGCGLEF